MHDFEMGERRATLNEIASLLRKVLSKTITPQAGPTDFGVVKDIRLVRFGYGQFTGLPT